MKQITKALALAAIAATALVSCKKELEEPVASHAEGIQLTIIAGSPVTKTYVEGVSPYWKSTGLHRQGPCRRKILCVLSVFRPGSQ